MEILMEFLLNEVGTQGIWFTLALAMGFLFKKEMDRNREEAKERELRLEEEMKEREGRLTQQLDQSNEQLFKSISSLELLHENFGSLNQKIEQLTTIILKEKG